jgi:uncharacterized protein YndB with AHSA1/START domain
MTTSASTDRIEKSVRLSVPRARVWRALTNAAEFGSWFGVKLVGAFAPGARLTGQVTHKGWEDYPFEITIDRMEEGRLLSWRWHANPDRKADLSDEPTTLVTFTLEDAPGGTLLKVVESGFDAIPPSRRMTAYRGNEEGWDIQMENIKQYVGKTA